MFRKTSWRNSVSDAVSLHQDQALSTTIFLLRSYGPTRFLLREEGEDADFKVSLGDLHTCSCPVFIKEQEPCKHICWVLLRKFRLPREHEYSFQHGLVDRQILEVLQGLYQPRDHLTENESPTESGSQSQPVAGQQPGNVCRKAIQTQDVCPICLEELLKKKLPVSYCRFGCGNNVHISCMRVWADLQELSDNEETVKCPLCREDFCSRKLLLEQVKNVARLFTAAEREKPDRHLGIRCQSCRVCPVTGTCYKCTVCTHFYLCEDCAMKGCHSEHVLASRTKRKEKWHHDNEMGATSEPGSDSVGPEAADSVPNSALTRLPTLRVRPASWFLGEGQQCRICLQSFTINQYIRTLPCQHKFHMDCVDPILQTSNSCPLDGYVIYNRSMRRHRDRKPPLKSSSHLSSVTAKPPEADLKDLFVPGVALLDRNSDVTHSSHPQEELSGRFQGLRVKAINTPAPVTEQPQGLNRQEVDSAAPVNARVRRTRQQPQRRHPTEPNTSELIMTGVLINTQQRSRSKS